MPAFKSSEVIAKVQSGEPVTFSFSYPTENIIKSFNSLFSKILSKIDLVYLLDTLITILREIIVNAVKANAKRVYFAKMNLNINDSENYTEGIRSFKKNIIGNLESLEKDLKKSDYRVNITLKQVQEGIKIAVTNNVPIHPEEMERITFRKIKALAYNDFTDAYEDIYDNTEGAGLGIVLVTLLLRNSGIDVNSYRIVSDGKSTRTSLTVPFKLRPSKITTGIKTQIIKEVDGIPTFPEHILILQRLCNDPNANINELSQKIMLDPAITSDLLKLSNSAGFITVKRIENVNEAIMIIGLKNLNAILIASSARRILDKRFSRFEQIWNHCNKVAYYARQIAIKYRLHKISENSFLAGLLHDLGKIVLLSVNLQLTNWIADIVQNRKIRTSTVMEEISIGISHSTIGELISKNWNFPDYIVQAIKFHHAPLNADENHRDLVFTTYLANMFCGVESRRYNFYFIEEEVLERFGLADESAFNELHNELQAMLAEQIKLV
jgi:HD-like signal output (HDOD) protein